MNKKTDLYIFTRIFIVSIIIITFLSITLIYLFLNAINYKSYAFFSFYILTLTLIVYTAYKWIFKPYKELNKVLILFAHEYIFKGIFDMRMYFNEEFHMVLKKFKEIIDTKELIEGSRKHAEYLALQNQINPHFLYNTLEGIRSEALIEGVDSIANMTENLATFFRYTISNVDKFVTLQDEIKNIESYYKIQEFRFGDKISLNIEFQTDNSEKILKAKLPKLTLQPFVENAIFHGLEKKIEKGLISLKISATRERLIIMVSDNGIGMSEEKVKELNQKLRGASIKHMKEDESNKGIALLNVNSRIKLIFGDEYGVYIYSKINSGTDVEITIPLVFND